MCDSSDGIESSIAITCVTRPGARKAVINNIIFITCTGTKRDGTMHFTWGTISEPEEQPAYARIRRRSVGSMAESGF